MLPNIVPNYNKNLAVAETIAEYFNQGLQMHSELVIRKCDLFPQQPNTRSKVQENTHVSTRALSSHVDLQGTGSMHACSALLCAALGFVPWHAATTQT